MVFIVKSCYIVDLGPIWYSGTFLKYSFSWTLVIMGRTRTRAQLQYTQILLVHLSTLFNMMCDNYL